MSDVCVSRFNIPFNDNMAKAFGSSVRSTRDKETEKEKYLSPFPKNAENAFRKKTEESSRFRLGKLSLVEKNSESPAYTEEAMSAFGKKQYTAANVTDQAFQTSGNQDGFPDDAIHAFGKKSKMRKNDNDEVEYNRPINPVLNNTISALVNVASSAYEKSKDREWSSSALRTYTEKPEIALEKEDFPALGSVPSSKQSKSSSSKTSFANLVKIRAEEDEKERQKREIEEQKRQEKEKKRRDELAARKQTQALYSSAKQTIYSRSKKYEEEEVYEKDELDMPYRETEDDTHEEEEEEYVGNEE